MDGKEFIACMERDGIVIDALHCAVYAMALTNGFAVNQDGVNGTLHFDHEIRKIRRALHLLGVDTTQALPAPYAAKKQQ